MGTRNVTIVRMKGEVKVAQYCQWDGYPTGQGIWLADFIQNKLNMRKLKKNLKDVKFLKDNEIKKLWASVGADGSGFVNMEVSDKFRKIYPYLHRDIGGADVLELIQDGIYEFTKMGKDFKEHTEIIEINNIVGLCDSRDFIKDPLYCEYAYDVDLDKKTVAVYCGSMQPYRIYKFKDFTKENMEALESELSNE